MILNLSLLHLQCSFFINILILALIIRNFNRRVLRWEVIDLVLPLWGSRRAGIWRYILFLDFSTWHLKHLVIWNFLIVIENYQVSYSISVSLYIFNTEFFERLGDQDWFYLGQTFRLNWLIHRYLYLLWII